MRRLLLLLSALLVFTSLASVATAGPLTDQTVSRLASITQAESGAWRFQHPAAPGGEKPDLDDSAWPQVRPEHAWSGDGTAAWYRQRITIPEAVNGASVAGARLVLNCGCDDDMEVFVNGEPRGKFHWDQGRAVITERAVPGESFLVAVKAINQGGPGRLLSASLTYDPFAEMRPAADTHRARLEFCRVLLGSPRIAQEREGYEETLERAAGQVDFGAVSRRDPAAFDNSLKASLATLQPFSALAKEYTLYLVGHGHIDMNWLWLWPETKEVCRLTWSQALAFMDEFSAFRYSQSQPGAYLAIEQENPALFGRIQSAVTQGRWEPTGASWVEGDTNMASGEALARHCLLTHEYYLEKFGYESHTGWYPDNFGHAWTVPSIFADAGIRYYYFCRCGKGAPLFWWEGPDGQRLAAYNFAGWYGEQMRRNSGAYPVEMDRQIGIPDAMLVYGVGDHGGGPTRIDIETARELQSDPLFPNVKFSTTDEFYSTAVQKSGGRLPVIRDELNFVFQGCYTSHGDAKRWNRDSENLIPAAETAATCAGLWTKTYPATELRDAWRNTLFNQFHDIFDGTAIHGSYDYSRELAQAAEAKAGAALTTSLDALAAMTDTTGPGQAFQVWNPVAWDRREYVELSLIAPRDWCEVVVTDAEGRQLLSQTLASTPEGDAFRVTVGVIADLPAMGYTILHARPGDGTVTPPPALSAEEAALVGQLMAEGGIPLRWQLGSDLVDTRLGLQILRESAGGMSAWNVGPITSTEDLAFTDFRVLSEGPVCSRFAVRCTYSKSTLDLTGSLYPALQRVDFDLDADWQEVGNSKDGGPFLKAALRTNATDPRATFEIPWGSIERDTDGAEVPAQKWIDVAQTRALPGAPGQAPEALDVSAYFTEDVIASEAAPADGDFDRGKRAYPASIFGEAVGDTIVADGIPFGRPPVADGKPNCIAAAGQELRWPARQTAALAVLGAASNGRANGMVTLLYADGTEQTVDLSLSDWCVPGGQKQAFGADFRYVEGKRAEPATYVWITRLAVNDKLPLVGIRLPVNPNLHLFGLATAPNVAYEVPWGISLLNDCKYGFDVKGGTMRMSLLRASYDPDPIPDAGRHKIRFAIYPHFEDWRSAQTPRRAHEFNNRPVVRPVASHAGDLPAAYTFVRVEPANMILAAFKPAQDGKGYIARVYNSTGVGGKATLLCNLPFRTGTACNLLEQPRETNLATVNGPEVVLDLNGKLHGTVRLQ